MKNYYLTSRLKSQLDEFLETWACGMARAVTDANVEMLRQLRGCQDILADGFCEQVDLPPGSSYGEAAVEILEMLGRLDDAWSLIAQRERSAFVEAACPHNSWSDAPEPVSTLGITVQIHRPSRQQDQLSSLPRPLSHRISAEPVP
jgi:hypothetical protein